MREPPMGLRHVVAQIGVRQEPAHRGKPCMAMRIDEARNDDLVGRVDYHRITCSDGRCDRDHALTFDQDVAFQQVADLRIHADDGAAFDERAAAWCGAAQSLEVRVIATAGRAARQRGQGDGRFQERAAIVVGVDWCVRPNP